MGRKLSVSEPNLDELCQLYKNGWSSLQLSKIYNISKSTILRRLQLAGIERRDIRVRGPYHPNWKTGRSIHSSGYIKFNLGGGKKVFEHRYIMEQHIGRKLKKGEEIHHINGNKQDNRIENLELCKNRMEHKRKHKQYDWSTHHPCCQKCKSTSLKHDAHGLCVNCSSLYYRGRKNGQ